MRRRILVLIASALACGSATAQTYGQPRHGAAPLHPRLPVGAIARQVLAPTPPAPTPEDPFVGPIRTLTYVVTPEIRVRPSEVTVAAPEIRFVTPQDPSPPSPPATDTGPK